MKSEPNKSRILKDKSTPPSDKLTSSSVSNLAQSLPSLEVTEAARELLKKEFDKQGLNLEYLVGVLKRGCEAKKSIINKYGEIVGYDEENQTQLKAAMSAFELRGELKVAKDNGSSVTNNFYDVKALIQQVKDVK